MTLTLIVFWHFRMKLRYSIVSCLLHSKRVFILVWHFFFSYYYACQCCKVLTNMIYSTYLLIEIYQHKSCQDNMKSLSAWWSYHRLCCHTIIRNEISWILCIELLGPCLTNFLAHPLSYLLPVCAIQWCIHFQHMYAKFWLTVVHLWLVLWVTIMHHLRLLNLICVIPWQMNLSADVSGGLLWSFQFCLPSTSNISHLFCNLYPHLPFQCSS